MRTTTTVAKRGALGFGRGLVAGLAVVVLAVAGAACGDDGDEAADPSATTDPGPNPSTYDPGPNPTGVDPGPNDTSEGPVTVQGTVRLDPVGDCIALETDDDTYSLALADYGLGEDGGAPALVARDDGTPIAAGGDTMIVAGFPGSDTGDCGRAFTVDSVVNVTPPS